eukprot:CFRG6543T1
MSSKPSRKGHSRSKSTDITTENDDEKRHVSRSNTEMVKSLFRGRRIPSPVTMREEGDNSSMNCPPRQDEAFTDHRRGVMKIKLTDNIEKRRDMLVELERQWEQQDEEDDLVPTENESENPLSAIVSRSSIKIRRTIAKKQETESRKSSLSSTLSTQDSIPLSLGESTLGNGKIIHDSAGSVPADIVVEAQNAQDLHQLSQLDSETPLVLSKAGWLVVGRKERWCEVEFKELRLFTNESRQQIVAVYILTGSSVNFHTKNLNQFRLSSPNYAPLVVTCKSEIDTLQWMQLIAYWAEKEDDKNTTAAQVLSELMDEFSQTWKFKWVLQRTQALTWLRDRLVMYSNWLCDVLGLTYNEDDVIDQMCFRDFNQLLRKGWTLTANTKWVIRPIVLNHLGYYLMLAKQTDNEGGQNLLDISIIPPLNVVMVTVGSRGDVQPFIVLAQEMKKRGHQVRIATHEFHRSFVTKHNIDFYMIPGDPKLLMAFMEGVDIMSPELWTTTLPAHRAWIKQLLRGIYAASNHPWDGVGEKPTHLADSTPLPIRYRADLIIANPPSFAAPHVAEAMHIPCHMVFTMPWTPTRNVPSPFIVIDSTGPSFLNYTTFKAIDRGMWLATRDMINTWRREDLGLPKLPYGTGYRIMAERRIPFCYCFSTHLLPRPSDWGPWIDVVGFWFYDSKTPADYEPDPKLKKFLADSKEKPIFIGFGSIVVNDPNRLTRTILEAARLLEKPVIIQQGWAEMNSDVVIPENVLMIGPCPHDWLFNGRVSAVVHHGGAGTMSTGLMFGNPTVIVPFILDQFFWGLVVADMGVGPPACPWTTLTAEKLCEAMEFSLRPSVKQKAVELGKKLRKEGGDVAGADAILRHVPIHNMRDTLLPEMIAHVWCADCKLRLSYTSDRALHFSDKSKEQGMENHQRYQLKVMDYANPSNTNPQGRKLDEEDDAYLHSSAVQCTAEDLEDVWEAFADLLSVTQSAEY